MFLRAFNHIRKTIVNMNKIVLALIFSFLITAYSLSISQNDINFDKGIILPVKYCNEKECILQKYGYALKSHVSANIKCATDGLKVAIKGNDGIYVAVSVPLSDSAHFKKRSVTKPILVQDNCRLTRSKIT